MKLSSWTHCQGEIVPPYIFQIGLGILLTNQCVLKFSMHAVLFSLERYKIGDLSANFLSNVSRLGFLEHKKVFNCVAPSTLFTQY